MIGDKSLKAAKRLYDLCDSKEIPKEIYFHIKSEEAIRLFNFITPYIEKAGYKWQAHSIPNELGIKVIIKDGFIS